MRVLHINCNYIGTTLHQLMNEKLDAMGCENRVFVPTYDRNLAVIKPNSNVCVSECFHKWDRLVFDYKQKKIMNAVESQISAGNFDIIHAYTLFTDGNCARILSKKYGIPYVVAIRNTDVNDFFRLMPHLRGRGVQIMCDAAAVFFLSESYRKQVFEKYIPQKYKREIQEKTHIIPNGIDDFWFQNKPEARKNIDGKTIKLVYAGRIDKNKNIPTTQRAVEQLRKEGYNVTLTVVGKIQDEAEFRKIQKNQYTEYFPAMPKEKLIDAYRQADIFVMPSFKESFGLVYAEAMSQGLPVVYSKGQGFDGQFEEGTVGYRIASNNAKECADAIEKIADGYCEISKNCVSSAAKFKWDSICKSYLEIYSCIVNRQRENKA